MHWIGRADDDALFNVTAVMNDLWQLQRLPGASEYAACGPFRNWYAWMPRPIMQAVCWSHGPRLFARLKARDGIGGNSTHACLEEGAVGPFPMAAGPLIVLTRALVARIAPALDADEEYLIGARTRTPLRNGGSDRRIYPPDSPSHPAQKILLEDVYLFSLIFSACQNTSLTLLSVTISEYSRVASSRQAQQQQRLPPPDPVTRGVHVYHFLKDARRFHWFSRPAPAAALQPRRTYLLCDRDARGEGLGKKMLSVHGCCGGWEMCRMALPPEQAGWGNGTGLRPKALWDFFRAAS